MPNRLKKMLGRRIGSSPAVPLQELCEGLAERLLEELDKENDTARKWALIQARKALKGLV